MSSNKLRGKLKKSRERKYLARDFEGFRNQILDYANLHFSDRIQDFSEGSFGGLLLDMASIVGDSLSFYLDHQFHELDPNTAIETKNVIRHLQTAGVEIRGAAPATVRGTIFLEIPAAKDSFGRYIPTKNLVPIINAASTFVSNSGIVFNLDDDTDFSEKNEDGVLLAKVTISQKDTVSGLPTHVILSREVDLISGVETEESFLIGDNHIPFREISLNN